jgi:FAD/FMN-containing dehydrogenase
MSRGAAAQPLSWGRYPRQAAARLEALHWRDEGLPAVASILVRGCGRSYGDSCLNEGGTLIDARPLDRLIAFDRAQGIVRCEAGVTLAQLLEVAVPAGWFLPVTPGTRYVTMGGAIANDVHGKNHHRAGTFGRHVRRLELVRSDGSRRECVPGEALFDATVGGLGLTGFITWAEVALRPIVSSRLDLETLRFRGVEEFLELSARSEGFEHVVAWVDATARGARLGRGLFMRANHATAPGPLVPPRARPRLSMPFDLPGFVLSRFSVSAFNVVHHGLARTGTREVELEPFFYPLDGIAHWNRLYGARGFVQHQCVVPLTDAQRTLTQLLEAVAASGEASFLTVVKVFGDVPSPGMLSFPRPGATLALDFPMRGAATLALLERLDAMVMEAGGAIYPAKDARMSRATFERSFPRLPQFVAHVDPAFSSSFWRRVHG